ncbi:nuclear factor of activated T-cells, cytoplasmic 1 [Boleophthalmus pectinirostris]|uniref:nuclear factor of activated T-cells, cytoplasmic 1 n=1 Tax=Boleophthalmus pectinirostris TaxID=150288 RepID=UPI000A1C56A8|nr:nuclear factor of activated T-cells, cytoplasmic 1 [Boleophthalmus pectinirostris]
MKSAEEDAFSYTPNISLSLPLSAPCLPSQYHSLQSSPTISVTEAHHHSNFDSTSPQDELRASGYFSSPRPNGAPALESPRIEITAYSQFTEEEVEESTLPVAKRVNSIVTLTLPNAEGYRDPSCLSPASSVSSRSCHSEASSYESSFSYNYDNSPQNSPWQSPSVSPKGSTLAMPGDTHSPSGSPRTSITEDTWMGQKGSRPNSPCGAKRKYSFNGSGTPHKYPYSPTHSPGLSPQASPRLSITDETWLPNTNQYTNSAILAAINALTTDGMVDLTEGIPLKARKTSLEHSTTLSLKVEPVSEDMGQTELCSDERSGLKKEGGYGGGFLDVPQHPYSWTKPKTYISPSLPALDWQLPSSSGQYSLQIEVQPRSHHRAHYETEGSRGAVKALTGHPVVQLHGYMESEPLTLQLFIGTADDRLLRPHAFYQVHRITGKTVSTPSHEALHNNTKVLEIPLLPENNMRAIIDCAGILKLRNSDIELRKGETDIGRKNTRVRMVFRVHITQSSGRMVSLQAASNPIECSQRSAQELPLVDKQSLETCPASGGLPMVLEGHNFQPDSKVMFVEKAQDGQHLWETEAKVERDTAKPNTLVVEVPPYRTQRLSAPVHVNFFVCTGKRKRSQYQRFTYVPATVPTIKTEPHDDFDSSLVCTSLPLHPKPYFPPPTLTPIILSGPGSPFSSTQTPQRITPKPPPPIPPASPSPKLHSLSPTATTFNLPIPHVSIIQETPGRFASSPLSQPSTPSPESPFSNNNTTNVQPAPSPSPLPLPPKDRSRDGASTPSQGAPVSIKQEPQELDQMYLDDVNEIIRNDLSSISVHSHA